jgi:predicted nucleic acid-binding protein
MTDHSFVDTNILLYANDRGAGDKRLKAAELLRVLWQTRTGVVSTQVLQEFFYNATRKLSLPLHVPAARAIVQAYSAWQRFPITSTTILQAIDLHTVLNFSFWDSLIVAAALESHCTTLYSEDLQHGQVINGRLTLINPFLPSGTPNEHYPQ